MTSDIYMYAGKASSILPWRINIFFPRFYFWNSIIKIIHKEKQFDGSFCVWSKWFFPLNLTLNWSFIIFFLLCILYTLISEEVSMVKLTMESRPETQLEQLKSWFSKRIFFTLICCVNVQKHVLSYFGKHSVWKKWIELGPKTLTL